jgi:hypothetical protein
MDIKEKLIEQRDLAQKKANEIVELAEKESRELTEEEQVSFDKLTLEVKELDGKISTIEEVLQQQEDERKANDELKRQQEAERLAQEKDDYKNSLLEGFDKLGLEDKEEIEQRLLSDFDEKFEKAENKEQFVKGLLETVEKENKKEPEENKEMAKFNLSRALVAKAVNKGLEETDAKYVQDLVEKHGVGGDGVLVEMRDFNTTNQSDNIDQNAVMPLSIIGKQPVWQMMGVRYLPNLKGNITLPHKDPSVAQDLAEKAAITHDTVTNEGVLLAPGRIGAAQLWTKELLASENPELHNAMISDMLVGIDRQISAKVYAKALAGATEVAGVALTKAGFDALMGAAEVDGDGAFASHRATFFEAKSVAIDAGSGRFLATLNGKAGITYDGVPYFFSTLFADGANQKYVIYGDFYNIVVGDWGMFEVLVNPYTYAKTGQVEIVVNRIVNVALQNPDAFVKSPDLDPTA